MKIKTFKIPCTVKGEDFILDEDNKEEVPHLEKMAEGEELLKLSVQVSQYNANQLNETKGILKHGGSAFIFRQIIVQ